ncbi:MAG: epoxyqueuosine reductase [Candidatus Tectomicrobia bacterium]|uniref:Epoxyqueuosine reductase n=1 Tax=Tectimicrobiota bacterium TaxID=2528274 RepID=A0A933GKF3_UNCTE|nr:epoxyqueuosine reductase [Candidatus Tectomicrobia bacterium]
MNPITEHIKELAQCWGAVRVGITTKETLAGGPPSTDLNFILPGAKSAVTFALPLNKELIRSFFAKKERLSHERDNLQTNMKSSGIAASLAKHLEQLGYPSSGVVANESYREEEGKGRFGMHPDLSHRYLAVRSGVGWFGFSGNVITPEYGAAVILGTCVTTAELEPTVPLPQEENYCDNCKLCLASCCSGLMDPEIVTKVTLGDQEFSYSKRINYHRCEFVCGGMTGLHPSRKWSTWSPGRFAIPNDDAGFREAMKKGMKAYVRRPVMEGGAPHVLMRAKLYLTCGNCQLLCWPSLEDRKENFKILTDSGVVIQRPDGTLQRVAPEEGEAYVKNLDEERRSLYV